MVSGLSFGSSAVSLACISSMCSVQCFSWRPFSSFSLWIILLPSDSCCFLAVRSNRLFFFLRCLRLRLVFCAIVVSSYFGATIFWRDVRLDVWPWLFAWLFRLLFHGLKVRQQLFCGFSPETDRLWICVHLPSSQAAHELSDQAVQRASRSSCPRA